MFEIFLNLISALAKSLTAGGRKKLIAENIALRHQLSIATRNNLRCPSLSVKDRTLFGIVAGLIPKHRLQRIAILLSPQTILRFHKALVSKQYQRIYGTKNRKTPGPKGLCKDLINAITETKQRNPRFGTQRIADQINLAFATNITRDQVRHILNKHYNPEGGNTGGPSWLTFLGHAKDSLWSIDFFKCHSITLHSYFVMLVMDQYTRRIIGFAVNKGSPSGADACRMFGTIVSGSYLPKYLSSDNDPLFDYHRWQANLRILDITAIKTIPHVPLSHPFVERLIGTIRRELLDQVLFVSQHDLENKLGEFMYYYNKNRSHQGLNGRTPLFSANLKHQNDQIALSYSWKSYCRGLFQLPVS